MEFKVSNCAGICAYDLTTKICVGCLRSSSEIATWTQKSQSERWQILEALSYKVVFPFETMDSLKRRIVIEKLDHVVSISDFTSKILMDLGVKFKHVGLNDVNSLGPDLVFAFHTDPFNQIHAPVFVSQVKDLNSHKKLILRIAFLTQTMLKARSLLE